MAEMLLDRPIKGECRMKNTNKMAFLIQSGILCTAIGVAPSCSSSDSSDEETPAAAETTTSTTTTTKSTPSTTSGQAVANATSVGDLKVSKALKINLPDALEGKKKSSLNLLEEAKLSQEACQMGETVEEVTDSLNQISSFFCHIEAEKEKIKFGKKYKIVFKGQEFGRIFVDDTNIAEGKIQLGFCGSDGQGTDKQLISIEGITEAGVKGAIIEMGSHKENGVTFTWDGSIVFDSTTAGMLDVESKQAFTEGENSFRRHVKLKLNDKGVSEAQVASNGVWGGNAFQDRGFSRINDKYGSALFISSGKHEGSTYNFSRRANFSSDGLIVKQSADSALAESGALFVKSTELPQFLPTTFAPDKATGWVASDCATVDEQIELDPDAPAHKACENEHFDEVSCWDTNVYSSGEEITP